MTDKISTFTTVVDGTTIFVRDHGVGAPLLLLHGVGCHSGMWGPLERALPGRRIISFDYPGVGGSPSRGLPLSVAALARLAEGLLAELKVESVDVLGYSFGGTVAQVLAAQAPSRVRRLLLVATAPGWGCVPGPWKSMIHLYSPLRFYSRAYYERTIGVMAGGQARNSSDFVALHAESRLASPPKLSSYYAQIVAAATWSSLGWLGTIQAPTLVIAGGDDPILPSVNGAILAARIPDARLLVHADDGHLLLFDANSPALPAIDEFLSAVSPATSETWTNSTHVARVDEATAISAVGRGMFPWGLASACYRGCLPALRQFRTPSTSAPLTNVDTNNTTDGRTRGWTSI